MKTNNTYNFLRVKKSGITEVEIIANVTVNYEDGMNIYLDNEKIGSYNFSTKSGSIKLENGKYKYYENFKSLMNFLYKIDEHTSYSIKEVEECKKKGKKILDAKKEEEKRIQEINKNKSNTEILEDVKSKLENELNNITEMLTWECCKEDDKKRINKRVEELKEELKTINNQLGNEIKENIENTESNDVIIEGLKIHKDEENDYIVTHKASNTLLSVFSSFENALYFVNKLNSKINTNIKSKEELKIELDKKDLFIKAIDGKILNINEMTILDMNVYEYQEFENIESTEEIKEIKEETSTDAELLYHYEVEKTEREKGLSWYEINQLLFKIYKSNQIKKVFTDSEIECIKSNDKYIHDKIISGINHLDMIINRMLNDRDLTLLDKLRRQEQMLIQLKEKYLNKYKTFEIKKEILIAESELKGESIEDIMDYIINESKRYHKYSIYTSDKNYKSDNYLSKISIDKNIEHDVLLFMNQLNKDLLKLIIRDFKKNNSSNERIISNCISFAKMTEVEQIELVNRFK